MTRENAIMLAEPVEKPPTLGQDIADIAETIVHWEMTGVGPIAVWRGLGRKDECERGWDQVRALMIQQAMQWRAEPMRLAA